MNILKPKKHSRDGFREVRMAQFPYQYSFFLTGHYLSHLPQLEPWQMDRSSCRTWRRASTRAETGTGMVGEAAAGPQVKCGQAIATASIASRLLSHHHTWHTSRGSCRSCCLTYHPSSSLGLGAGPPPSTATRPIHLPRL